MVPLTILIMPFCYGLIVADIVLIKLEKSDMDIKKTIQQHKQLCSYVSEKKVKQCLDILSDMLTGTSSGDLRDEYENLVMTYRNMLTYTMEGINDPERNKVYLKLIQSILELSDKVRQDILSHSSGWNTYWTKQQAEKEQKLSGKTIVETVDDLMLRSIPIRSQNYQGNISSLLKIYLIICG
jgi:hypothetical protein